MPPRSSTATIFLVSAVVENAKLFCAELEGRFWVNASLIGDHQMSDNMGIQKEVQTLGRHGAALQDETAGETMED